MEFFKNETNDSIGSRRRSSGWSSWDNFRANRRRHWHGDGRWHEGHHDDNSPDSSGPDGNNENGPDSCPSPDSCGPDCNNDNGPKNRDQS